MNVELDNFSTQYEELLETSDELQKPIKGTIGENDMNESYFCSDTVSNPSNRDLSESEIKVLEKILDLPPIQRKIKEPELGKDFMSFAEE